MADDSGQRLLDVIGDPSALDAFLGSLTADTVPDNVVASLARSLAAEFDVGSPNETLFESSSSSLTDISRSTVTFDFEPNPAPHGYHNHDLSEYNNASHFNPDDFDDHHLGTEEAISTPEMLYRSAASATAACKDENPTAIATLSPFELAAASSLPATKVTEKVPPPQISSSPASGNTPVPPPPRPQSVPSVGTPALPASTSNGPTHVYVATSTEQTQYASIGQIVQQQNATATMLGMNPQLALNSQQIIIDPTTGQPMMVSAQGNTFGTTNLLVAGVQPTYTMPLFSNTITMQPQIQAIKTAHGTTAGFIQATTTGTVSTPTTSVKSKAPPQLLPKPNSSTGGTTPTSADEAQSVVNTVSVTSTGGTSITMTTESLSQILQQQQNTAVTNALAQPSFAIGAGGQVVQVSGMQTLNSISGSQIFMNQFGQQMLLPTVASSGVQFIVRQQPQPQMLTIQAPTTATTQATTSNGKVVRFVQATSQVPQVTQNSTIQLQQIQTAQGPTWVAVRSGPVSTPMVSLQPPPPASTSTVSKTPTPPPPAPTAPQAAAVVQVTTDTISATIQSVIERLRSPSPPVTSTVPSQYSSPIPSIGSDSTTSEPPPRKKPKYSKKKKVTLDLEQLLKQSGIMDEDLQDDGGGFSFGEFFSSPAGGGEAAEESGGSLSEESSQQNGIYNNNNNTPQKDYYKPNGTTVPPPTTPFVPTVPPHSHILKPSTKSKQRKNVKVETPETPPGSSSTVTPTGKKSKKKPSPTITGSSVVEPNFTEQVTTPKSTKMKPKKKSLTLEPEDRSESTSSFGSVTGVTLAPVPMVTPIQVAPQPRRIVQTIQLTPQNQTLLRNIQAQIQKLLSLTSRNDNEETALQNFISLQSQVIKTGTPVPNPPHLLTLNNSSTSGTTAAPVPATSPKVNGVVVAVVDHGCGGVTALANGVSSKAPTTNALPPLLVSNKSSGQGQLVITNPTDTVGGIGGDVSQKYVLLKSLCVAATSATTEHPATSTGDDVEMTSSVVNITPTTTISTAMAGRPVANGLSNGVYYDSYNHDDLSYIDEKKLEEQLRLRLEKEEEARIQWRKDEFEKRLVQDHQIFLRPDSNTQFRSLRDAAERLMPYHVARDTAEITFEEFDEDFADTSVQLLNKFSGMVSKYRALLLKDSMKDVVSSEQVMLERMFVAEETLTLEHDRGIVQQGEILDLPHPPPSWLPRLRIMVETEVKEMERDSLANQQVQCAIDSIMSFEPNGSTSAGTDDKEKIEYDAFGVPISNANYSSLNSSSADIDEAVRSILL